MFFLYLFYDKALKIVWNLFLIKCFKYDKLNLDMSLSNICITCWIIVMFF